MFRQILKKFQMENGLQSALALAQDTFDKNVIEQLNTTYPLPAKCPLTYRRFLEADVWGS